jgi:hypothetical protein
MASPFIRRSALKGPTGSHRMPRVPAAARKLGGLMTPSTSAVAVCWSRASRVSVMSRVFSIAMTAWSGESANQFDLPFGEGVHAGSHEDNAATLRE